VIGVDGGEDGGEVWTMERQTSCHIGREVCKCRFTCVLKIVGS